MLTFLNMEQPLIYSYSDYREYLRNMYSYLKEQNPHIFSYRYFAGKAKLQSPNYLKMVIDRLRHLSTSTVQSFGKALKLNKEELSFFETLVSYNKAFSEEERQFYFQRLKKFKKFQFTENLTMDQYEYFTKWYIPVIREMTLLPHFNKDPEWIAKNICPKISPYEAKSALDLLFKLQLVFEETDGSLKPTETTLSTGEELTSLAVWNFHREMINQSYQALKRKITERNIVGMTISLSSEQYEQIKRRIYDLFLEIQNNAQENTQNLEDVCQINVQQFWMTRTKPPRR